MTTFSIRGWSFTIPIRFVEHQIPTEAEAQALRLHLAKYPNEPKPISKLEDLS